MALSDDYLWEQAVQATIGGDVHITKFARAIEAEVRKQDTELIRQMRDALSDFDYDKRILAIAAASARLEGKP